MTDRALRRLVWVVWAVAILAYLGEVVLLYLTAGMPTLDPADQAAPWLQALENLAFVAVATLGLLIVLRQPSNVLGWWIMAAGLGFPVEGMAVELVQFGTARWGAIPLVLGAAWVARWIWLLGSFNLPFLLMLYPDGHLPNRRWRPLLWGSVAVVLTAFVAAAFSTMVDETLPPNPLGVDSLTPLFDTLLNAVIPPTQPLLILLALLSLVARYRKGEDVERQQVKVLLWVGAVTLAFFSSGFLYDSGPVWLVPVLNLVFTVFVGSSITLAILRYRLFEIDRLISRTVTYSIVAGALAAIYAIGAVWLPGKVVETDSPVFVAGSTLLAAALFNPLRRRVMRWVERRFNRRSYDPQQVVDDLNGRLREPVDSDQVLDDWTGVVELTFEPATLGVWVRDS